jgi:hypothetical protein
VAESAPGNAEASPRLGTARAAGRPDPFALLSGAFPWERRSLLPVDVRFTNGQFRRSLRDMLEHQEGCPKVGFPRRGWASHRPSLRLLGLVACGCALLGCSPRVDESARAASGVPADLARALRATGDGPRWLHLDPDTPAEERRALLAAAPFLVALIEGDWTAAYAQLAAPARARMSLNQFEPAPNEAEFEQRERHPERDVTPERFAQLMAKAVDRFGLPVEPLGLHVQTLDPATLSGGALPERDGFETLFALGRMPDDVAPGARRASLRGMVRVELPPERLEEIARWEGVSARELAADPDFAPALILRLVLVEDFDGAWRIGYFELFPPGEWD